MTISEDLSSEPLLRVWALDQIVKKTGLPTCLSELRISNRLKQFPISAFAALDDLSQLAVGFANGSVTVIRGDLIHDLGTRQRIVHEGEEPITGVEFVVDAKTTTLFVATTSKLLKLLISGKGQQAARTVEDAGCAANCMTINKKTGDIIVVREDAVYYYTLDGRGLCFANDGATSQVAAYKDYIALVSLPSSSRNGAAKNMGRSFGGANAEALFNASTFSMVDPALQIVAHSETLISQVKDIFQIWGDIFVLMQDGKVGSPELNHTSILDGLLTSCRSIGITRNLCSSALSFCTSAICIRWPSIWLRRPAWMVHNKMRYTASMAITYTRKVITTVPCRSISKP